MERNYVRITPEILQQMGIPFNKRHHGWDLLHTTITRYTEHLYRVSIKGHHITTIEYVHELDTIKWILNKK